MLDPLDEESQLPAQFVDLSAGQCQQGEVAGQEFQPLVGFGIVIGLAVDLEFALQDAAYGRSREALVGAIGLGQQLDIGGRITVWEAVAPRGSRLDDAVLAPAAIKRVIWALLSPLILTR